MECERLQKQHDYWNKRKNSQGWTQTVYTWVTYISCMLDFLTNYLKKGWGITYWRHVNNPIPDKMKYNTQYQDDPTTEHFMWGDPSDLK